MRYEIEPIEKNLQGNVTIPPSKSHTLRAILFASLARGKSTIENYLISPDTTAMILACRQLGAKIEQTDSTLIIHGVDGEPKCPDDVIDAGNSGQVLRFITGIAALLPTYTVITGDHSVRHQRPMQALIHGINQLGGFAAASRHDGYAPIIIRGPLHNGIAKINSTDSQPVSALLIAAAFIEGETAIEVLEPGEIPWIKVTLSWLTKIGVQWEQTNFTRYKISGKAKYNGFHYKVPGDFSSAAFPIVAALITQSNILLENIDMQDVQGDKAVLVEFEKMGAKFVYDDNKKTLEVKPCAKLQGINIAANDFIDAVPILAILVSYAEGHTIITKAEIARHKESDRLTAMAQELSKMGGKIVVTADGLDITHSTLQGATVYSHQDHRIAMALAIAALRAQGKTVIEETACVAKSYPDFVGMLQTLGVKIREC